MIKINKAWRLLFLCLSAFVLILVSAKHEVVEEPKQLNIHKEIATHSSLASVLPPTLPQIAEAEKQSLLQNSSQPITLPHYLPPIANTVSAKAIYSGDLSDYEAYQAFQSAQDIALKQSYIEQAGIKVKRLEQLLARGKLEGLPESELHIAEEKIKALQLLSKQLQKEVTEHD